MSEPQTINGRQATEIAKSLRAFGYDDVTAAECLTKANAILAGEEPTEIIGMFIERILEDSGVKSRD